MSLKKKAFISQPMLGKTDEEIKENRKKAISFLESRGYEVVDNIENKEIAKIVKESNVGINYPLWCLGNGLLQISICDVVYFCAGWENARGCKIEHTAAESYGVSVLYEEKIHEA